MKLINPEVRIETTSICNANCTICARETMKRRKTIMADGLFEDIVLQVEQLGATHISLFGFGEPLCDKNIAERIAYCSDLGFETFITTNASLLDVNTATNLLEAGLNHIRFSVHAIQPNDYNEIHRGLKYETVMRNIANFIGKNNLRYNHQCKVSVSVIPMHNETVDDICERWHKYVDYLEVWRPHNWGPAKHYRSNTLKRKKSCGRPHRGPIQIQADGKVIPCCFLTDNELVLGDLYKHNLEFILTDKPYNALRLAHETGKLKGYPCNSCDQLNIEKQSPLLYSNRDKKKTIGCTSSTKFNLEV
jgi:radical SAM protein with 4Fe4S-binding SPASM domain